MARQWSSTLRFLKGEIYLIIILIKLNEKTFPNAFNKYSLIYNKGICPCHIDALRVNIMSI